ITLTSSTGTTYSWLSGQTTRAITVNSQGSYRVTVTGSNGCAATSSTLLVNANGCTPPAVPTITLSGSNVLTSGQTVTLTSSTAGGYLWSNGATTKSITVSTAGPYSVRAYNAGSCYSTSLTTTIYVVSARLSHPDESVSSTDFTAYPNPASSQISFSFSSATEASAEFRMMDLSGRILESRSIESSVGENRIDMDLTAYARGIYMAALITGNEQKVLKIFVQ
ncbi:MAG TPA: T9SS type A sorting domain-containing protein, partial [Bacteroidia bacterium]|nr:T9SS type A sorting domain-containing protein [Bacteroidia bacterium]